MTHNASRYTVTVRHSHPQLPMQHVQCVSFDLAIITFPHFCQSHCSGLDEPSASFPDTQASLQAIKKESGGQMLDCVLHDGAPNVGGNWSSEAYSQSALVLESLRLATDVLAPRGSFVTKIFRRDADHKTKDPGQPEEYRHT